MNIEFTGKYDAVATKRFAGKVYDRIARGMWVFGCVFFVVCAVVGVLQLVSGRGFSYSLLAIAVVLLLSIRLGRARYQKNIDILSRRYFSDSEEATVVMTDDYYEYDEENYRVVGEHTGKEYKLGRKLKIMVKAVDEIVHTIDFLPV